MGQGSEGIARSLLQRAASLQLCRVSVWSWCSFHVGQATVRGVFKVGGFCVLVACQSKGKLQNLS